MLTISNFFTPNPPKTDRRILIQKALMEGFTRYATFVETLIDESPYIPHIVNHLILCRSYTQQGLIQSESLDLSGAFVATMPPIESVYGFYAPIDTRDETCRSIVAESRKLADLIYESICDADCLHHALGNLTVSRNLLLQAIGYQERLDSGTITSNSEVRLCPESKVDDELSC